jgi:hypothetical protein
MRFELLSSVPWSSLVVPGNQYLHYQEYFTSHAVRIPIKIYSYVSTRELWLSEAKTKSIKDV